MRHLLTLALAITLIGCNVQIDTPVPASPKPEAVPASPSISDTSLPTAEVDCDPAGTPFGGGNGTADAPNAICSTDQLRAMGGFPNDSFLLAADLDFTGLPNYVTPGSFHGTFDGGGHTITGLKIRNNVFYVPGNISFPNHPTYLGLWYGLGNNALVKNLKFAAVDISGENLVAVVAPTVAGLARIENVSVLSGSVAAFGGNNFAVIAAINDGTVHQCNSAIGNLVFAGVGVVD